MKKVTAQEWGRYFFLWVGILIIQGISFTVFRKNQASVAEIVAGVFLWLSSLFAIFLFIKSIGRLNDIKKSGWWMLLVFIPVIGWGGLIKLLISKGSSEIISNSLQKKKTVLNLSEDKKMSLNLLQKKEALSYWKFIVLAFSLHVLTWILSRVLFNNVGNDYLNMVIITIMPIEIAFIIALRTGNLVKAILLPVAIPTILFFPLLLFSLLGGPMGLMLFLGFLILSSMLGAFIGKLIYIKKSVKTYDNFSKILIIIILVILHIGLISEVIYTFLMM